MIDNARWEKIGLLALAGGALVGLIVIAIMAINAGKVDANSATIVGVIIGGLIAFQKDIVAAIRGYSMSAQLGKVTDQLAASGPATMPAPQSAKEAADQTASAAMDEAAAIGAQS